jgi:hypothetical protein
MTYSRPTSPKEDIGLAYMATVRSERLPVPMTAQDLYQAIIDGAVADLMNEYSVRTTSARATKFSVASAADQAAVDLILAKY